MTSEAIRAVVGWSAIINPVIVTIWFLVFCAFHDGLYRLHRRWFSISPETFDTIHYAGMALYKISIWLFFVTPYLAMRLFV